MSEIADIVRSYLPDAKISFDTESGSKEVSGNYMIDNARLMAEFGVQYRPYCERVPPWQAADRVIALSG